jgi:signal transduction histidine kinase
VHNPNPPATVVAPRHACAGPWRKAARGGAPGYSFAARKGELTLRRTFRTRITTRVVALSAATAVLLGVALVLLIVAVTSQRDAARTAFRSQEALAVGSQLENSLITMENGLRGYVASGQQRLLQPVSEALQRYPLQTRALARLVSDDPVQRRRVAAINTAIEEYVDFWVLLVIGLATDAIDDARSQLLTRNDRERLDPIRAQFDRLFSREREFIESRQERAESRSARAIASGIGGLAFVIAVALGITMYLRRSILRPVLTVADATARLAAGDLDTRVPAAREDELGDLARGFNTMADSLARGRAQLERSNAELSRSNAELEQFASVTSHDLQAPLTTISMYTELLERKRDGGHDGDELVKVIRDATHEARALIRDLLEYSRAGKGQMSLERVPAAEIVEASLERLAGAMEQTGAEVEVGELPVILADRANVCRVFQNLIGNALKFTSGDRRPRVTIEADRDGDMWRFCVRDNGIGMEAQHTERIFEPFRRLHGEEDYPGTGIGLAVCERIIDQHGGRIWVSSTPGEGSVFFFTLPAVDHPLAEREALPTPAGASA